MSYGITAAKVVRRKGKGYTAINLMLVKNRRDGYGRSGFDVIWNFGTIRSTNIEDKANAFWKEVELVFSTLVAQGKIYAACAERAMPEFEKHIPKPIASVPSKPLPIANPLPIAKPNPTAAKRIQKKFGNLL